MGFLLPSHIDQGVIFGILGLWHLSNTLWNFLRCSNSMRRKDFRYRTWFPLRIKGLRCVELWSLLVIVILFLSTQISHVIGNVPNDAHKMQRIQHMTFGIFFLVYTIIALLSDFFSYRMKLPQGCVHATFALGFAMELLLFHFGHHSGDSLESFVHMLMQLILFLLVVAMLTEILLPKSFLVSVARSMLLLLKGAWFFYIGLLINLPSWTPHGCTKSRDDTFPVCDPTSKAYMIAKSMQVIILAWEILIILVFTYVAYIVLLNCVPAVERLKHLSNVPEEEEEEDEEDVLTPVIRSLSRRVSYKALATP